MDLQETNKLLRKALVKVFFEPELEKLGYSKTSFKHPSYGEVGISKDKVINICFDLSTGCDYPDGDEWLIVEYLLPFEIGLPDNLKSPDYFSTFSIGQGRRYWRHRELIRYKHGKVKRLSEALSFIDKKAEELYEALSEASVINEIDKKMKS